jgi:hypothetical protein
MHIKAYYYVPVEGMNAMELVTKQYNNVKSISVDDGNYIIITDNERSIFKTNEVKLEIV